MNNDLPQVEAFRAQLDKLGSDYICNTPLPESYASVLFLGPFQVNAVVWNMTVATLVHYRLLETQSIAAAQRRHFDRPFIEIMQGAEGVFPLRVGLDLAVIDEAVIKKTIIMIRNYKRLAIGQIQFGATNI
jgi:hypothetical protein